MKKTIILLLVTIGCFSLAAKKDKQEIKIPDVEAQMEKTEKIESYRAKKDVAWHKKEYNKVIKYLNKSRK